MTTATDIQAQLEGLWESAEPGPFGRDDAIILKYADGTYAFRPRAGYDDEKDSARVVERAKPKRPQYVVAGMLYAGDDDRREPFIEREDGYWESAAAYGPAGDLIDPVPLVEMPSREEVLEALEAGRAAWRMSSSPIDLDDFRVDAVLELLRGERKA